jgi:hypothetical protein
MGDIHSNTVSVINNFIRDKLDSLEAHSMMWATSKEAFAAHISMLLELYNIVDHSMENPSNEFFAIVFGKPGTCALVGLDEKIDPEWCAQVLTEGKKLMPNVYY